MKFLEVFGCLKETLEINSQPDEENQLNNRSIKNSLNNLTNGSYTNLNNQELKQQVSIVQKLANSTGCLNKNFQKSTKEKKKKSSTTIKMTIESTKKNENCNLSIQYSKKQNDLYAKTAGFIVGSSIYGQLLVVICLTLFTAEICTSLPLHYFEVFYLYLYSVSILFLLYVFVYLLRGVRLNELKRREQKFKKEKISEFEKSYCSIFLRIGAVIFGLSSMVYNGLEFVSFFEIPFSSQCYSIILLVNPVLQATFTFAQMYLIFTYSRLMIHKFKLIARIGLMHLIGTNICVWIRILVKETLQELKSSTLHSTLEESILLLKSNFKQKLNDTYLVVNKTNPCGKDNIMGNTLNEFFEFGVLFIVEYSLIGAAFFYVMWSNTNSRSNLYIYNQSKKHISQLINNQNAKNQSNQETNSNNAIQRSGSISPCLSMSHLNNSIIDTNGVLFNNTNQMETNLNHALVDTNSSSCSPTNQTTNSILPSSPQNPNLVTNIQCTPPANRNVLMINTHQLASNYGQSNCSSNNMNAVNTGNNSNVLLLDNLSVSSRESLNEKYQQFSSYKLNSMYNNNLMMMNSTQSLYSCLGSSKGLFCGFLSLVISITSLIIFFVLVHHTNYHLLATLISDTSHSILLILSIISSIVAYFKIKKLKFQRGIPETADGRLRDLLLKVAAFGLYIYAFFGVIAGSLELYSLQNIAVLTTSTLTIIQVTLQSLLISDVVCRKRSSAKQPGRQLITFLLIINLTLWVIYTFEMQKIEASPVQLKVFGFTTWALIVRITLPLSIFYRFHCAITFAEIWKNSYK